MDGSFNYTTIQRVGFHIDIEKVSVFPNPTKNELFINLKAYVGKKGVLTMTNQFGQMVKQIDLAEINKELLQINTSRLTNGLYYLNVQMDNQRIFTKKVMIHRLY